MMGSFVHVLAMMGSVFLCMGYGIGYDGELCTMGYDGEFWTVKHLNKGHLWDVESVLYSELSSVHTTLVWSRAKKFPLYGLL